MEFARFYGETDHFKLNFSIENLNFSQFFVSGIHIHTFSHHFAEKNFRFIGTLKTIKGKHKKHHTSVFAYDTLTSVKPYSLHDNSDIAF